MNELIDKLAHKAGYKHPDAVGDSEDYAYFSHKEFAELIVRECIDNVKMWEKDSRNHISYMLKKHFGVEE